jgi:hypothetical protein
MTHQVVVDAKTYQNVKIAQMCQKQEYVGQVRTMHLSYLKEPLRGRLIT